GGRFHRHEPWDRSALVDNVNEDAPTIVLRARRGEPDEQPGVDQIANSTLQVGATMPPLQAMNMETLRGSCVVPLARSLPVMLGCHTSWRERRKCKVLLMELVQRNPDVRGPRWIKEDSSLAREAQPTVIEPSTNADGADELRTVAKGQPSHDTIDAVYE